MTREPSGDTIGDPTAFTPRTSSTVTGRFCAYAGNAASNVITAAVSSRLISPPGPRSILSFCLMSDLSDHLVLPLDYAAIERILPHRYPFLLVDRVKDFEPDRRIVGIKNVSLNERYLWHGQNERPVLPPTILTEAIAQVGA